MATDMVTGRRNFLSGLLAAGIIPRPTWADVGAPAYLAAAAKPDGSYTLCGISAGLDVVFEVRLPARGHAAAAHPTRPEAVAFARRPGTFAVVINCASGNAVATLTSPEGRHFYGHGVFSADGAWLFTTENNFEAAHGVIGVWDVAAGYIRTAEFHSGGIGPHDVKRLPGTDTFVIANGGIDTHPDTGRAKLNIPTMQPNLSYIEEGRIVELAELPTELHKNSIRHLAINATGDVAFGMQWQGDAPVTALVAQHQRGNAIQLMDAPADLINAMNGYIGSIAYATDGATIAATSPRGSLLHLYDAVNAVLTETFDIADVSGVAPHRQGFAVTSGTGALGSITAGAPHLRMQAGRVWDNHLVSI